MWQVVYVLLSLAMVFLSWPPFLYRRFAQDGAGRPLGRAILWSFGVYVLAGLFAELTFRWHHGGLYPFLLLIAPLPVNAFWLVKRLLWGNPQSSPHGIHLIR